MILHAIKLSLTITAIYILLQEGMLLGWLKIIFANIFDLAFSKRWSIYLQKPLWGCLTCMSSVWTIVLTGEIDVKLILIVCGINAIIDKFLANDESF